MTTEHFGDDQAHEIRSAVRTAMSICETGFYNRSRLGFQEIKKLLSPYEAITEIKQAIALCGADTISPRFAYPHIESLLQDVLDRVISDL